METPSKDSRIYLALRALKQIPSLSLRKAAAAYNVPRSTLTTRQQGTRSRRDSRPKSAKLTTLEEETVVEYVLDLDARLYPPRMSEVKDMADRLLKDRGEESVGRAWTSNFIKRQPELRTRFSRRYDYKRAQCENTNAINAWFHLVQNVVAKYGIEDADIYNFDETGFMMGIITNTMVVTSAERRSNVKKRQPGNREWATVIQGVGATGYCVPPFIIVSGKFHLSSWYENSPLLPDWAIATSENGWTTNDRGLEWIQHFDKHTKSRTFGRYRLLILDGHESHRSVDFELHCKNSEIITLCMPPHSSHILQPLDVGCFGPLKKAYGRQIETRMKAGTTYISKEDFFEGFLGAYMESMTESNIKGGFRGAGIVPHDPEAVLSTLDTNLTTPSPPGTSHGEPEPWTSKTPTNVIEAGLQTEFIKGRISCDQESSPTSVLGAVDQFAKGTTAMMHQMALLKSENMVLRDENDKLSRRRRAKKTRLQEGGSMTLAEGQSQQAQNRAVVQEREGMRQNNGRKPRVETKKRRCGVCGNTGHNSRTCQAGTVASKE